MAERNERRKTKYITMTKFFNEHIKKFTDIIDSFNPQNLKSKNESFCDSKMPIRNQELYEDGVKKLHYDYKANFGKESLVINGNKIEYFTDMNLDYFKMCAFYMSQKFPAEDVTTFYFKKLSDLSAVNSYPILPTPTDVNMYSGWLDSSDTYPSATRPACVQIKSTPNDYTIEDIRTSNPSGFLDANISSYDKPGYKNIYFNEGYVVEYDLKELSYQKETLDPETRQELLKEDYTKWLTSSSEYPDIRGVMKTTTPYPKYSYKDFLFRLKSWGENPIYIYGELTLPFHTVFSEGKHKLNITEFRAFYYGINVDMTPQEVYNHFHKMRGKYGYADGIERNSPITLSKTTLSHHALKVVFYDDKDIIGAPRAYKSNNVVDKASWVTGSLDGVYGNYSSGIKDKLKELGVISLNSTAIENCEGCTWGSNINEECSNDQNTAFPFDSQDSCENFKAQYPDDLYQEETSVSTQLPNTDSEDTY